MNNTERSQVEIIRIGKTEYAEFSNLLEWRRTSQENAETTRYQAPELHEFIARYDILSSDTFFIYAARLDGKLIGYVNAVLIPKPDPRLGLLYIDELWTAPTYRGYGVAGRLLSRTSQLAKELNLWRVRLYVGTDNDSARACYRKAGFSEKGECLFCELSVEDIQEEA